MSYRYDFACEICDWPRSAKNLLTALDQRNADPVEGLKDYFMNEYKAKFVYTTYEEPTTHVLFPSEYEATMFLLRWS